MVKERDSSGAISNSSAVQVDLHWHIRLLCYSLHFSNSICPETKQKDKTLSQRRKKKQNLMWDSTPKLTWFVRSRRRNVVAGWRSAGDWLTRLRLSFHPQVSGTRRRRRNDRWSPRKRNCKAELRSQNLSGGRQLHLLAGSGRTRRLLSFFESAKTTTLQVQLPLRANSIRLLLNRTGTLEPTIIRVTRTNITTDTNLKRKNHLSNWKMMKISISVTEKI